MKDVLRISMLCFILSLLFVHSYARPVNTREAIAVAGTFIEAEQLRWQSHPEYAPSLWKMAADNTIVYIVSDVVEVYSCNLVLLAYIVELKPEGFIIVPAYTDMKPILGYSFKGAFPFQDAPQNFVLHLVQWDIEERLRLRSIANTFEILEEQYHNEWSGFLDGETIIYEGLMSAAQWGPGIKKQYEQSAYHNLESMLESSATATIAPSSKSISGHDSTTNKPSDDAWQAQRSDIISNIKNASTVVIGLSTNLIPNVQNHVVTIDGYRDLDEYFHINNGDMPLIDIWYNFPDIPSYTMINGIKY